MLLPSPQKEPPEMKPGHFSQTALAEATIEKGQQRFEKEARMMEALAIGGNTLDLMGLSAWRERA